MEEHEIRLHRELATFVTWACFVGIAIPFLLVFAYDIVRCAAFGHERIFSIWVYGLFAVTPLVAVTGSFYTQNSFSQRKIGVDRVRRRLYATGVFTSVLVGVVVLLTGGALRSIFAFYLLYLPMVVAVAFTPSPGTKAKGLIITSFACAVMIFASLCLGTETAQYRDVFYGSFPYKSEYFLVSLIQLGAIIGIERKSAPDPVQNIA